MGSVVHLGTWAGAIGFGVMAGVYFTFSTFVMRALAALPRHEGVASMASINEVILSSAFMPLFWGTSILGLLAAGWSIAQWGQPGSWALLAGGVVYVLGMFAVTAAGNVPLNEALAAVDPTSSEAATLWSHYLSRWTLYNHVRTVASALASGLFVAALLARA